MRIGLFVIAGCLALGSIGCEAGPKSGIGLRLPEGDLARGEKAFHDLGCDGCHAIVRENRSRSGAPPELVVALGGKVAHIESHGKLVTSIINPSHGFPRRYPRERITEAGQSKMPNFNETMTVEQLIDLTAYLQSKYELERGSHFID
jgi:mono/diheme cytochrome c family protein